MRLNTAEQQAIRQAIASSDQDAIVYLFGSRVDDNAGPTRQGSTHLHDKMRIKAGELHEFAAIIGYNLLN